MRARNIKPGFFVNDELAECEPLARILFAGLWCLADRSGRLEDRPKRIKAELLPYDDADADALLQQLADRGFIVRYDVGSDKYIAIPAFGQHQNPHRAERASVIPAPPTDSAPCLHSTSTVQEPCKHDATSEQAPETHTTNPADSGFLIPDSGFLIPEARAPAVPLSADDRWVDAPDPDPEPPPPKRRRFAPPTVDDVAAYCRERNNSVDAEAFIAHYTANGWKVGRNGMKDWRAAVVSWERNGVGAGRGAGQAKDKQAGLKIAMQTRLGGA